MKETENTIYELSDSFIFHIKLDISEVHLAVINTFSDTDYQRMVQEWNAKPELK